MSELFLLDNSKRSTVESCPRKYYLSYIRNLESINGSTSLRYGTCWHELMDVFYANMIGKEHNKENIQEAMTQAIIAADVRWQQETEGKDWYSDYRSRENLILSFAMYIQHFNQDHIFMKVTSTERKFNISMFDSNGQPFIFAGKIDGEATLSGLNWNIEHKTTGQPLFKQEQRLNRSAQFIGYTFAGQQQGKKVEGTLVMFHHLSATKSRKTGEYGRPKVEFKRIAQMFSKEDILNWKQSLCYTAAKIRWCEEKNRWPMQFDSCYQFGACRYIDICEQNRPLGEEDTTGFFERVPWDKEITVEV